MLKYDSKAFFIANVFGYDEYFSFYSQKNILCELHEEKIEPLSILKVYFIYI